MILEDLRRPNCIKTRILSYYWSFFKINSNSRQQRALNYSISAQILSEKAKYFKQFLDLKSESKIPFEASAGFIREALKPYEYLILTSEPSSTLVFRALRYERTDSTSRQPSLSINTATGSSISINRL